jgi:hypothetical protein
MKLILKKDVDWNAKYGFEDEYLFKGEPFERHFKTKRIKTRRIPGVTISLLDCGDGRYTTAEWVLERTKETKELLKEMIANGDAKFIDEAISF